MVANKNFSDADPVDFTSERNSVYYDFALLAAEKYIKEVDLKESAENKMKSCKDYKNGACDCIFFCRG